MGVVCKRPAPYADGVHLLDILSDGHKAGHGAEGLVHEVRIKTCDNHTYAAFIGQFLDHIYDAFIEELGFVDAHNLDIGLYLEHPGRGFYGRAGNAVGIVGHHVKV